MAKLDTEWAITGIDKFLHVTEQVKSDNPSIIAFFMRVPTTEVSERAHVVEQILERVLPGWSTERPAKGTDCRSPSTRHPRRPRCGGRPTSPKLGDSAPDMDAANLHPWTWENGRSFWNNGQLSAGRHGGREEGQLRDPGQARSGGHLRGRPVHRRSPQRSPQTPRSRARPACA